LRSRLKSATSCLELAVLFAQLAQFTDLGRALAAELFLPGIERIFRYAELASNLTDRRTGLGLTKRVSDLLIAEAGFFHGEPPVD